MSMEFFRKEYGSGLPFPSPRGLSDPKIKPRSPALKADSLPSELPGKPKPLSKRHQIEHTETALKSSIWMLVNPFPNIQHLKIFLFFCYFYLLSYWWESKKRTGLRADNHETPSQFMVSSCWPDLSSCSVQEGPAQGWDQQHLSSLFPQALGSALVNNSKLKVHIG